MSFEAGAFDGSHVATIIGSPKVREQLRRRRRALLCLWILIDLGVPIGWLALKLFGARPDFVFSKDTTRFTQALRSDGYLNFPRLVKDGYPLSDESPADSSMMQVENTSCGWDAVQNPDHPVSVYEACIHALGGDEQVERSAYDFSV